MLQDGVIKAIITPYRDYLPTDNMLPLAVEFAMASQYSNDLSNDVKVGLQGKFERGWRPNLAPLGYLNDPDGTQGKKEIFVDPHRWPLVRKLWDMLLTDSYTVPQLLEVANDELSLRSRRGKKLSLNGLYGIFHNIFYTGNYWHDEELKQGKHKPMITMQEYDHAQVRLGAKGKPAPHTYQQAYTGAIWCSDCGGQIIADPKRHCVCTKCKTKFSCRQQTACPNCDTDISKMTKPIIRDYLIYRCGKKRGKCTQGGINVTVLEKQIDQHLAAIQLNDKYVQWSLKYLKKAHRLEGEVQKQKMRAREHLISQSGERLNKLLEMRMSDELSPDEYKEAKQKEMAVQAKAKSDLEQALDRQHNWLELTERTFNFAHYARFWYADAQLENDLQKKREILTTLGSNLILKDKILHLEAPAPFKILAEALQRVPAAAMSQNTSVEPAKTPSFADEKARQATPVSVVPEWSG